MERTRDLQRDHAGAGGRVGGERLQGGQSAGGDDLAAAVVVGGGELELLEARDHRRLVAADDRAHAGLLGCGGLGHRAAADADEPQRVFLTEDAGGRGGGELADRVTGDTVDEPVPSRAPHDSRLAATMSGCATCVSRMRSASHSVPAATRSTPAHSE